MSRPDTTAGHETLAQALRPAAVDLARLSHEYGPLLRIVRMLIGVVPNCDPVLAIWPLGFRTYNLLVPNLLNLPFSVWGFGPPAVTLGLALCAASRTAQCAYCTAHTCAFTLRRGSAPEKIGGVLTPAERAAVAVAEALARIPCDLTAKDRQELSRHFSAADAERIALGVALMGFLNKFMDATGIDLEEASVDEVSAVLRPIGWTPGKHRVSAEQPADPELRARPGGPDTLGTKLGILRHLPAAIRLERSWTRGIPSRWPAVGVYLKERTGHDFPLLARVRSRRAVRAIATVLRDNLIESDSHLGLRLKHLAGLVYASAVGNEVLAGEARSMAVQSMAVQSTAVRASPSVDAETLEAIARFGAEEGELYGSGTSDAVARLASLPGLDGRAALALVLAKAVSPSPAMVPPSLIAKAAEALSPEAQVELVVWLSIQQMLHRLGSFHRLTF
jgi:alkylhydroperoxidase family enzyme